ncbi:MAG: hemerythrin domain-containing protein [Actinomycetota bacterium]|nr:hemerythrin domain-containing protein [Actinomycetota bacterium]MDD5667079.1 hemerythrin domain-containing protein [Actinomycetota bacterium]
MMPIGPLMTEHRLIERMAKLLEGAAVNAGSEKRVDAVFIDRAVDFFRTYADRTHHGKEEDILFRELEKKGLSEEHERVMLELVEEHRYARRKVGMLVEAREVYLAGDPGAANEIEAIIMELVGFYAAHITKEDRHFFIPVMEYFNRDEQDAMLEEFREFDRGMIHEKYRKVVESYEDKKRG